MQTQLINLLKPNATIVGDDMQSIYGFRGAYAGALQDFKEQYSHPDILRSLSTNYRHALAVTGSSLPLGSRSLMCT